jgi:dihydrofolate reductase
MAKVIASITTSIDGYVAGPGDGPGKGLGEGGERLHYWVFGGPWSYDDMPKGEPSSDALDVLNRAMGRTGAIVVGRWMYEAAGHWGDKNPWNVPVFVVTHRPEEEPDTGQFNFVGGFDEAIERARDVAGGKDVAIGGGADVIRQGLAAGVIDELALFVAPVILGGGKSLFDGFTASVDLDHISVRQLKWATLLEYRVRK